MCVCVCVMASLIVHSHHGTLVLYVSVLYVGLITTLRLTVDETRGMHRSVHGMVDHANDFYARANAADGALARLNFASMALALYDVISEAEGASRAVVDRLARCDVQRRRRRLRRTVDGLLVAVPTAAADTGSGSVSAMPSA